MCCIFTCCGWMIDLIQRAWVFAMSCCISSAVCCVLMISSMSGVALGYNYSLAEYIDLKETNVSVYLKRGVFDDDVSGDMNFRRSAGHEGVRGFVREGDDLITPAAEDENKQLLSGRRLDDSIMESDDHNRFEGSLMKLTAKPVHSLTTTPPVTSDEKMQEIISQYPGGSLDQLKAIQSLISMRKADAARDTTVKGVEKSTYGQDERYVPRFPIVPVQARRGMYVDGRQGLPGESGYTPSDINPARYAVPDAPVNDPIKWMGPKFAGARKSMEYDDFLKYPSPIIYRTGPIRPTRPLEPAPTHTSKNEPVTMPAVKAGKSQVDREMDAFKEKLILDKYESPRNRPKEEKDGSLKSGFEYYEDDIKGLPVRRKRYINRIKRKVTKALHQKLLPPVNAPDKKENSITNEISHYPSIPVSRLLRLSALSSKSFKSKMNVSENDINSTTDRIVEIIQSMFS